MKWTHFQQELESILCGSGASDKGRYELFRQMRKDIAMAQAMRRALSESAGALLEKMAKSSSSRYDRRNISNEDEMCVLACKQRQKELQKISSAVDDRLLLLDKRSHVFRVYERRLDDVKRKLGEFESAYDELSQEIVDKKMKIGDVSAAADAAERLIDRLNADNKALLSKRENISKEAQSAREYIVGVLRGREMSGVLGRFGVVQPLLHQVFRACSIRCLRGVFHLH